MESCRNGLSRKRDIRRERAYIGALSTAGAGPTYVEVGRIRRPTRRCSSTCAHHPATRDAANVGAKSVRGMPIASSKTAV